MNALNAYKYLTGETNTDPALATRTTCTVSSAPSVFTIAKFGFFRGPDGHLRDSYVTRYRYNQSFSWIVTGYCFSARAKAEASREQILADLDSRMRSWLLIEDHGETKPRPCLDGCEQQQIASEQDD